jgi:GT2 family glycosyltransferase
MDPAFFMYCEEIDWCRRFKTAGWRCAVEPRAVVVHHAGASTGQFRPQMTVALWRSRLRLFRRYEPRWRYLLLRGLVAFGLRRRESAARRDGATSPEVDAMRSARLRILADA